MEMKEIARICQMKLSAVTGHALLDGGDVKMILNVSLRTRGVMARCTAMMFLMSR